MIRIGVLGAGHLGKIHIRLLQEIDAFQVVGFHDPDIENAQFIEKELGVTWYADINQLLAEVDAIDVVTPTVHHFDCASRALRLSKHVFIEKPITHTLAEARDLLSLAAEANVTVQIGHVERFNAAFMASVPYIGAPMFIETHRLAQFNPRGTDVSVILDLMIHDIDIILSLVKSGIKKVNASGVAIVSDTPDIANARIEFDNGCVANLTASRISLKNMRKSRFFQKDAYISVDFLEKKAEVIRMKDIHGEPDPLSMVIDLGTDKGKREIIMESPKIGETNAIRMELQLFAHAIVNKSIPPVTIRDGYDALNLAYQILDKVNISSGLLA